MTIYKDGIFRIGNKYSKSYRFIDINYVIASEEDKRDLFLKYGELLNSFDSSVMVKITINNREVDLKKFEEDILIPYKSNEIDIYRKEYNDMLLEKLSESDNMIQEKYITVTCFKNNIKEARSFFSRAKIIGSLPIIIFTKSAKNLRMISKKIIISFSQPVITSDTKKHY